ncbi:hypothetical protein F1737_09420 [Methanoplanus sp. FWC-SCC4]|uniref:Uncharacterized protein n=1 Tax=Methanochimaera problematica TaxID=2609417 RepID=A0AA97I4V5_9EURY|nr:hypothetical protein [Methanoplanus sp. FWC-SCC4]WOF16889.1 hypothetical protein F1737_09420 [Methanoplanus sp. FWC-SCC4]
MNSKEKFGYFAFAAAAIAFGFIAGLALTSFDFPLAEDKRVVIYLDNDPGILGNWTWESKKDFRRIYFAEDNTFEYEEWTAETLTVHMTFHGRWDEISKNTYKLNLELIRPDIEGLNSLYKFFRAEKGIYIYDTLTDKNNRVYKRADFKSLTGNNNTFKFDIYKKL